MFEGPSELFELAEEASLVIMGSTILGIAGAMALVPLFSTIIDSVREKQKIVGKCENLHDKTSAIFNMCWALGSVIAPITGGAMNDTIGFSNACDVMMLLSFIYGAFFFVTFVLPELLKEKQ
jgi:MFS family permease